VKPKPAYKPVPHIEKVTWLDHSGNYTRDDFTVAQIAKRVKEEVVNVTIGMLVYEDDSKIVLATEARVDVDLEEALFSHYTTIYKFGILGRKKL